MSQNIFTVKELLHLDQFTVLEAEIDSPMSLNKGFFAEDFDHLKVELLAASFGKKSLDRCSFIGGANKSLFTIRECLDSAGSIDFWIYCPNEQNSDTIRQDLNLFMKFIKDKHQKVSHD